MTTTELLALKNRRKYWSKQASWAHLAVSEMALSRLRSTVPGERSPNLSREISTGMLFDIQLNGKFAGKGYFQLSSRTLNNLSDYHVPVLVESVLSYLRVNPSGIYVDGTLGGGGHAAAILNRLSLEGKLIGIDRDPDALAFARNRLSNFSSQIVLRQANFERLADVVKELGFSSVDGVLLDLGVSSHQIDSDQRGFSFLRSGPLDMRMGSGQKLRAYDVVNRYEYKELKRIFKFYGEERHAGRIALAIVNARKEKPLETTDELVAVIDRVVPGHFRNKTRARIFQAIRIEVNGELAHLQAALKQAVAVLKPGGRLVVISYHSLEDRLTKQFFKTLAEPCDCPPEWPICPCDEKPAVKILTRHPVTAPPEEIAQNSRARSAKLRAVEKTGEL